MELFAAMESGIIDIVLESLMKNGTVESYPGLEACARLHENIKPKIFLYFYIITFRNTILVA